MADLAAVYSLGSQPDVKFTLSYDTYRSGTTVYYRFKITVPPMTGTHYYGYDLRCDIVLNGSTVVSNATIKGSSPKQWSSTITKYYPSSSGWYSVSGVKNVGTVSASALFKSNTGKSVSSGSRTVSAPAPKGPSAPSVYLSTATAAHTSSVRVGVSGGSWGDGGAGTYKYRCRVDGEGWQEIYSGTDTSASFIPADYGASPGSGVDVFAVLINSFGQQSPDSDSKTLTCAGEPLPPESPRAAPNPMRRGDAVTLTWNPANPVSGSISQYEISMRYDEGGTPGEWAVLGNTTAASMTTTPSELLPVKPRDRLAYRIRAQNSYGLWSGYSIVFVEIKGGLLAVKIKNEWNEGQAHIKQGDVWKDANAVYIKAGGAWHEQN